MQETPKAHNNIEFNLKKLKTASKEKNVLKNLFVWKSANKLFMIKIKLSD